MLDRAGRALESAPEVAGDGEPGISPGRFEDGAADLGSARPSDPGPGPATPALARAVEHISLLVKVGAAPSVTLQLGRSLDVQIDQARAGVEVTLRPVAGMSPMAEAELPHLLAALRARGVRIARSGVLGKRPGRDGRRSDTDHSS